MAVTWDNPDVQLTDTGGAVVGSHDLLPSGGGGCGGGECVLLDDAQRVGPAGRLGSLRQNGAP